MRIMYLNFSAILTRTTNAIQVVNACAGLAKTPGVQLTLITPKASENTAEDPQGDRETVEGFQGDLWDFYGITPSFDVRYIACPLEPSNRKLLNYCRIVKGIYTLLRECACHDESFIVYSRALRSSKILSPLLQLLFPNRFLGFFGELHDMPKDFHRLKRLKAAVTNSETLRQDLIKEGAVSASQILTARNGVALDVAGEQDSEGALREKLDLPAESSLIVYTGRLRVEKGVAVLIEAFMQLRSQTDARLLLVGKLYNDLRAWLPDAKKLEGIHFLGYMPPAEVRQYQHCADVLVLPSTRDLSYDRYTMPLKLFEYMAAGRPVVASRLEGICEVIEDRCNGLLVAPSDPEALADALREVLDDPSLGRMLAEQAKKDVLQYTWEARAQRVTNFIRETLA